MKIRRRRELLTWGLATLVTAVAAAGPKVPESDDPVERIRDSGDTTSRADDLGPKLEVALKSLDTTLKELDKEKADKSKLVEGWIEDLTTLLQLIQTPVEWKQFQSKLKNETSKRRLLMTTLKILINERIQVSKVTKKSEK